MKHINSTDHDSIFRNSNEAVKQFHWETVHITGVGTTGAYALAQLVGRSSQHFPLFCLISSMILKSRNQQMGLVQRATYVNYALWQWDC